MKAIINRIYLVIIYMIYDNHGEYNVPNDVLRDYARFLLPRILKMYQSEEGKKQLEAWRIEQEEEEKEKDEAKTPNTNKRKD